MTTDNDIERLRDKIEQHVIQRYEPPSYNDVLTKADIDTLDELATRLKETEHQLADVLKEVERLEQGIEAVAEIRHKTCFAHTALIENEDFTGIIRLNKAIMESENKLYAAVDDLIALKSNDP